MQEMTSKLLLCCLVQPARGLGEGREDVRCRIGQGEDEEKTGLWRGVCVDPAIRPDSNPHPWAV